MEDNSCSGDCLKCHNEIPGLLLDIEAVKFDFENLFTFASGIKSPMYIDNRISLSYYGVRQLIRERFIRTIMRYFPEVNCIAGVATGAISQATSIADRMQLPLIYVRSQSKSHGTKNLVEGVIQPHAQVVVIEDTFSTGSSVFRAVEEIQKKERSVEVLAIVNLFNYGFYRGEPPVPVSNLVTFTDIIDTALKYEHIDKDEYNKLIDWHYENLIQ